MSALIFDRTQADADRAAYLIGKIQRREMLTESEQAEYNAGLRGCYNITDLNRVEAKVRELAETLRSYGYSVDYTVPLKGASVLPSGYTELEYIQSSGTQYINTGYKPTGNTQIVIDFQMVNQGSSQQGVFGSRPGYSKRFTMFTGKSTASLQVDYGTYATLGSENTDISGLNTNSRNVIEVSNNLIINGTTIKTVDKVSFTSTYDLYLFANNNIGSVQLPGSFKLYSFKIYEESTLVHNYVPCKNTAGVIGIYDTVAKTFLGNSGSGTFTAGNEIVGDDREWQYGDTMLESDVLLYLANIAALRNVIKLPPDVPPIPTIDRWIDWMAANDIERIVYELDRMIYGIVPLFRRCGTFRAGKNAQHLLLAKGVN